MASKLTIDEPHQEVRFLGQDVKFASHVEAIEKTFYSRAYRTGQYIPIQYVLNGSLHKLLAAVKTSPKLITDRNKPNIHVVNIVPRRDKVTNEIKPFVVMAKTNRNGELVTVGDEKPAGIEAIELWTKYFGQPIAARLDVPDISSDKVKIEQRFYRDLTNSTTAYKWLTKVSGYVEQVFDTRQEAIAHAKKLIPEWMFSKTNEVIPADPTELRMKSDIEKFFKLNAFLGPVGVFGILNNYNASDLRARINALAGGYEYFPPAQATMRNTVIALASIYKTEPTINAIYREVAGDAAITVETDKHFRGVVYKDLEDKTYQFYNEKQVIERSSTLLLVSHADGFSFVIRGEPAVIHTQEKDPKNLREEFKRITEIFRLVENENYFKRNLFNGIFSDTDLAISERSLVLQLQQGYLSVWDDEQEVLAIEQAKAAGIENGTEVVKLTPDGPVRGRVVVDNNSINVLVPNPTGGRSLRVPWTWEFHIEGAESNPLYDVIKTAIETKTDLVSTVGVQAGPSERFKSMSEWYRKHFAEGNGFIPPSASAINLIELDPDLSEQESEYLVQYATGEINWDEMMSAVNELETHNLAEIPQTELIDPDNLTEIESLLIATAGLEGREKLAAAYLNFLEIVSDTMNGAPGFPRGNETVALDVMERLESGLEENDVDDALAQAYNLFQSWRDDLLDSEYAEELEALISIYEALSEPQAGKVGELDNTPVIFSNIGDREYNRKRLDIIKPLQDQIANALKTDELPRVLTGLLFKAEVDSGIDLVEWAYLFSMNPQAVYSKISNLVTKPDNYHLAATIRAIYDYKPKLDSINDFIAKSGEEIELVDPRTEKPYPLTHAQKVALLFAQQRGRILGISDENTFLFIHDDKVNLCLFAGTHPYLVELNEDGTHGALWTSDAMKEFVNDLQYTLPVLSVSKALNQSQTAELAVSLDRSSTETVEEFSPLVQLASLLVKRKGQDGTLNDLINQLDVIRSRDWQLQIELDDPALARAYRNVFSDASSLKLRVEDDIQKAGKLSRKIYMLGGEAAKRVLNNHATYVHYGYDQRAWEAAIEDWELEKRGEAKVEVEGEPEILDLEEPAALDAIQEPVDLPAWQLRRDDFVHQEFLKNPYYSEYVDQPHLAMGFKEGLCEKWKHELFEHAKDGPISKTSLDDYVAIYGRASLRDFRGVHEYGAKGYELPPLEVEPATIVVPGVIKSCLPDNFDQMEYSEQFREIATGYAKHTGNGKVSTLQMKFAGAFLSKDVSKLSYIANGANEKALEYFSMLIGVKTPSNPADAMKLLNEWASPASVADMKDIQEVAKSLAETKVDPVVIKPAVTISPKEWVESNFNFERNDGKFEPDFSQLQGLSYDEVRPYALELIRNNMLTEANLLRAIALQDVDLISSAKEVQANARTSDFDLFHNLKAYRTVTNAIEIEDARRAPDLLTWAVEKLCFPSEVCFDPADYHNGGFRRYGALIAGDANCWHLELSRPSGVYEVKANTKAELLDILAKDNPTLVHYRAERAGLTYSQLVTVEKLAKELSVFKVGRSEELFPSGVLVEYGTIEKNYAFVTNEGALTELNFRQAEKAQPLLESLHFDSRPYIQGRIDLLEVLAEVNNQDQALQQNSRGALAASM